MAMEKDYEKWDKSTKVSAEDMYFIKDFNRQLKEKEKANNRKQKVTP